LRRPIGSTSVELLPIGNRRMDLTTDVEGLEERDQIEDNLLVFVSVPRQEVLGEERFEFLQQLLRKGRRV
jgi:hypothetical protein